MRRRSFWFLGITEPVLIVASVVVLSWIKPDYSHIFNTISELGDRANGTSSLIGVYRYGHHDNIVWVWSPV